MSEQRTGAIFHRGMARAGFFVPLPLLNPLPPTTGHPYRRTSAPTPMRRYAAQIDDNQPEIVKALRAAGASVEPLHAVGGGVPDLLVGYRGVNYLLEVKNPMKSPAQQALTKKQKEWHPKWRGQLCVVRTVGEALRAIRAA